MAPSLAHIAAIAVAGFLLPGESAFAANCAPLEMRLMQLQARGDTGSSEAGEVRAMLEACRGNAPADGAFWSDEERPVRQARAPAMPGWMNGPSGTFRTVCVRSCDGYYFPISFSTTRDRLEADEAACQRMCPAGDVSLFYYARRGERPEQMVSISGTPYTTLENAFRYRSELDESCICGTPLPDPQAQLQPLPATPMARREPGEDPETLMNRRGMMRFPKAVPVPEPASVEPPVDEPREAEIVRVVLLERSAEQDRLVLTEVPGERFRPEEGPFLDRGPGPIECLPGVGGCRTR